jgi:hypothetical protein
MNGLDLFFVTGLLVSGFLCLWIAGRSQREGFLTRAVFFRVIGLACFLTEIALVYNIHGRLNV